MIDKELFKLYVANLEETKRARDGVNEIMEQARNFRSQFQERLDVWTAHEPHDPAENLGLKEHSRAIREASMALSEWREENMRDVFRSDDELFALAKDMLAAENYDLQELLTRRRQTLQHRFSELLPLLMGLLNKIGEAQSRFNSFVDECNAKDTVGR